MGESVLAVPCSGMMPGAGLVALISTNDLIAKGEERSIHRNGSDFSSIRIITYNDFTRRFHRNAYLLSSHCDGMCQRRVFIRGSIDFIDPIYVYLIQKHDQSHHALKRQHRILH